MSLTLEEKIIRLICKHWFIFSILALIASCEIQSRFFPTFREVQYRSFNEKIEQASAQNLETIKVEHMVDFPWDMVCYAAAPEFYESTTHKYSLFSILGKPYDGYIPNYRCDTMSHNDLVFIKDKEVVVVVEIDNCTLRPGKHKNEALPCYGRDAYITLKDGKPWPNLPGGTEPYKEIAITDSP